MFCQYKMFDHNFTILNANNLDEHGNLHRKIDHFNQVHKVLIMHHYTNFFNFQKDYFLNYLKVDVVINEHDDCYNAFKSTNINTNNPNIQNVVTTLNPVINFENYYVVDTEPSNLIKINNKNTNNNIVNINITDLNFNTLVTNYLT